MKKYIYLIISSLAILSCSKQSDTIGGTKSDSVGGSLATFSLVNDHLYVVDTRNLSVFSVKDPQNPVKVNSIQIGFNIETLFAMKEYLFIGSRNGMYIYSIKNPETPKYISDYQHFTACDPVVTNSDMSLAFVTLHSTRFCGNNLNVLQIYDISNLERPKKILEKGLTKPQGLVSIGKNVVICDDDLKFFSVEDPKNPVLVHSVKKTYKDLIFHNNTLFAFGEREVTQYTWTETDFKDLKEISTVKY